MLPWRGAPAIAGVAVGSRSRVDGVGIIAAASSVAGLLVRAGAGVIADRGRTDGYRPVAWLLAVGAAGLLILAVGTPLSTVVGGIMAFAGEWGWPALWFYALVRSHMGAAGVVTGAVQSGGMIGSSVGPLAFGLTAQATSVGVAWMVIAAATVLSVLLVLRAAPDHFEAGV